MERHVRVLIADDCAVSRDGSRALVEPWPTVELIGEATTGREAVQLVVARRPDAVLMDVQMPLLNGLRATRIIKSACPETRVIVLTTYAGYRGAALAAGADAFLLKGCPAGDLAEALLGRRASNQAEADTEGDGVDPRTPGPLGPR